MKFIEIDVTSSQVMRAEKLYDFHNLKNSITKGDSQLYGAIGEVVVMDYLTASGIKAEYVGDRNYDLMLGEILKADVKTVRVKVPPRGEHNANISAYNTKQETHIYIWAYVREDTKKAWIIGWLDKETFFEEAKLNRQGEEHYAGWEFKSDTYSMQVKDLIDMESLISNINYLNMSATKKQYEEVREDLGLEFQPTPIQLSSNLWTALAGFQQEVPVIHKATQGYGYTYADLTKIIQVINPILAKHGLGYTQPLMGTAIKTIVFHIETGQTLESVVEIPQGVALKGMNDFQVLGSAISYLRRYSLASILTLITDADLDASGEQLKKKAPATPPALQAPATPKAKPPISEKDFLKLCGAINAKKEHNGEIIDEAWAERMYALTKEQLSTIQMINK